MIDTARMLWASVFGSAVVQKFEGYADDTEFLSLSEEDQGEKILGESVYLADVAVRDLQDHVDSGCIESDNAVEMIGVRIPPVSPL